MRMLIVIGLIAPATLPALGFDADRVEKLIEGQWQDRFNSQTWLFSNGEWTQFIGTFMKIVED